MHSLKEDTSAVPLTYYAVSAVETYVHAKSDAQGGHEHLVPRNFSKFKNC